MIAAAIPVYCNAWQQFRPVFLQNLLKEICSQMKENMILYTQRVIENYKEKEEII